MDSVTLARACHQWGLSPFDPVFVLTAEGESLSAIHIEFIHGCYTSYREQAKE